MSKIDVTYHNLLDKIIQKGYTYEDPNRKGVNRLEILSYTFKHEFKNGFPAITTKKLNYKNVVTELIWFLRGDTNIKYLVDNGCNIWNKDAYNWYLKNSIKDSDGHNNSLEDYIDFIKNNDKLYDEDMTLNRKGDVGKIYGAQWRNFNGVDQISNLIKNLKDKPLGTDHIVNAWNVGDLDNMALPPCHYGFQIIVRPLSVIEQNIFKKDDSDKGWTINHDRAQYGFELHWQQRSVDTFLG